MKVAIMQPTFIPWLGYFAMISAVDCFVFLDDVQFARRSWQNRNRIKGPYAEKMLTLPVARAPRETTINAIQIAATYDHDSLLKQIKTNLENAPFIDDALSLLDQSYSESDGRLCSFNTQLIRNLLCWMGITTRLVDASSLQGISGQKAYRLLSICQHLEADSYLSAPGSADYLRLDNPFSLSDVRLCFQSYQHPVYDQHERTTFLPYMSVIDALAWQGSQRLLPLIRSGIRSEQSLTELAT